MTSVSTCAQSRAISPEARRERAEMSDDKNPRVGPRILTATRSVSVMSPGVTVRQRPVE
jgi:hypothetical protein